MRKGILPSSGSCRRCAARYLAHVRWPLQQQKALAVADRERDDAEPLRPRVAQDLQVLVPRPGGDRPLQEPVLELVDPVGADRLLELEDEAGPDRAQDRRRASLLTFGCAEPKPPAVGF